MPPGLPVPALLTVPDEAAKTRTGRVIGITPSALEIIEHLSEGKPPDEPLCPAIHNRAFKTAAKRIGYHQVITLRDLRHCHESWGAFGTGDAAAAMSAAGHSDLRTTQLYLHSNLDRTTSMAVAAEAALKGHTPQRGHSQGGTVPLNETSPQEDSSHRGPDTDNRGGRMRTRTQSPTSCSRSGGWRVVVRWLSGFSREVTRAEAHRAAPRC